MEHTIVYMQKRRKFESIINIFSLKISARALHRLLEYQNHQVPWPVISGPTTQLLPTITKRLNEASGPYQMFTILGDIILFNKLVHLYLPDHL